MPGDAPTLITVGAVVSIFRVPAGFLTAPDRTALFPAPSAIVAPELENDAVTGQIGRVIAGDYQIVESQCAGARAARVARDAAVVEFQYRSASNRYVLAEIDRQLDRVAGIKIAVAIRDPGAGGA